MRPIDADGMTSPQLILVHDMSFVTRRSEETRRYLFYFFAALSAGDRAHHRRHRAAFVARLGAGLRALLRGEGILRPSRTTTAPELRPIARDLRELIRDLERQYRPLDGSQRIWDQQALRATLRSELHGNDVIVVANREPYIHMPDAGRHPRSSDPASGLVTALEPVDARVLGHVDRARQRLRRPRDRRSRRSRRRAARAIRSISSGASG